MLTAITWILKGFFTGAYAMLVGFAILCGVHPMSLSKTDHEGDFLFNLWRHREATYK